MTLRILIARRGRPAWRLAAIATIAALPCIPGPAHSGARERDRALIPGPATLRSERGWLRFDAATRVSTERPKEDEYAVRLLGELARGSSSPATPATFQGLRPVRRVLLRHSLGQSTLPGPLADQRYSLRIEGDSVVIAGPTGASRLHGAQTLRQLALDGRGVLSACRIEDGPALRIRGLSLDLSRGRLPTPAEFIRILDVCSAFKLNMVQVYIEDTYPFRNVPSGALRGYQLTRANLRLLSTEANRRHITLIPIVQTLGHQERMLAHPSMWPHAELLAPRSGWDALWRAFQARVGPWLQALGVDFPERVRSGMFAVNRPATQELVRSMLDDVLRDSGAPAVHIGCDEATEIGRGHSAEEAARRGPDRVFLDHVSRMAAHVGRRWNAAVWLYDDFLLSHPTRLEELPPDAVLVDWRYDPNERFSGLDSLRGVPAERIVTSAGLWNWLSVYPNYAKALPNMRHAVDAARARGCRGTILASWGDGGAEDLFGNDVYGIAYFAERAWSERPRSDDEFAAAYAQLRFGESSPSALVALRILVAMQFPNVGYSQRLVYRPVLVRPRTPAWRRFVAEFHAELLSADRSLAQVRPYDLYADAELQAMRSSVSRLLAATERELTLDRLAGWAATRPAASTRASAAASLARLMVLESRAAERYSEAWLQHNEASELRAVEDRMRGTVFALDSLRRCALEGTLEVPERFRRRDD